MSKNYLYKNNKLKREDKKPKDKKPSRPFRCNKCGQEWSADKMHKIKKKGVYCVATICLKCRSAYYRAYYQKNKEKLKQRSREWTARHKEPKTTPNPSILFDTQNSAYLLIGPEQDYGSGI